MKRIAFMMFAFTLVSLVLVNFIENGSLSSEFALAPGVVLVVYLLLGAPEVDVKLHRIFTSTSTGGFGFSWLPSILAGVAAGLIVWAIQSI